MDFDKFDDPNFNPFASKKAMQNSPPRSPVEKMEVDEKPEVQPVTLNQPVVQAKPEIVVEPEVKEPEGHEPKLEETEPEPVADEPVLPKGAYSIDCDKFDDPNFNPFETKKAMQNSPPSSPPPPKGAYSMDFDKFEDPNFNPFATKKAMQNSPPGSPTPKVQEQTAEKQVKLINISSIPYTDALAWIIFCIPVLRLINPIDSF